MHSSMDRAAEEPVDRQREALAKTAMSATDGMVVIHKPSDIINRQLLSQSKQSKNSVGTRIAGRRDELSMTCSNPTSIQH